MENVLLTGGAGFIGSHTLVELLERGYQVAVVDNLCNSCEEALARVKKITGKDVLCRQQLLPQKQCITRLLWQTNTTLFVVVEVSMALLR